MGELPGLSADGNSTAEGKNLLDRTSDLVRIRDNQRRSRARRKEYVSELETKWRHCEQIGAQASAEIQAAARKVAEENRRLRQLLAKHGIDEREVEDPGGGQASALEGMLEARRPCGGRDGKSFAWGSEAQQQAKALEESQTASTARMYSNVRPAPLAAVPTTQSGHCSTTNRPSPSNTIYSQYSYTSSAFQHHTSPASHASTPTNNRTGGYGNANYQNPTAPFLLSASPMDSYAAGPDGGSSCQAVAEVIRYVRPNVGREPESEMGCEDGRDCSIPNTQAFELMDRFSDGTG